jgi:predicted Rossmann fold nucleotide-binding protein DprA/Smf involved in DNA uptake
LATASTAPATATTALAYLRTTGGMVGIVCYPFGMRLTELDAAIEQRRNELQALETAKAVLGGSPRATPRRASTAHQGAHRGTRAPRGARREQVLAVLSNEPAGPSAIARSVGMSPQHVTRVLVKLQDEKQAKKRAKGWTSA